VADKSSRLAALRAVAAQLLFTNRYDKKFVDLISFPMMDDDDGQGQILASEVALETLIRNLAEDLDVSYLAFNALDECSDREEFIMCFRRRTEHTSGKAVVLTRPHIRISESLGGKPLPLKLEQDRCQRMSTKIFDWYSTWLFNIATLVNWQDFCLPAIIDRAKDSVARRTYVPKESISDVTAPAKRHIRRVNGIDSITSVIEKKKMPPSKSLALICHKYFRSVERASWNIAALDECIRTLK
jgi:hypothetical protein